MKEKIKLKNNFHNTEITLLAEKIDGGYVISKRQMRRSRDALCGIKHCMCSGELGQRGSENNIEQIIVGYDHVIIVPK